MLVLVLYRSPTSPTYSPTSPTYRCGGLAPLCFVVMRARTASLRHASLPSPHSLILPLPSKASVCCLRTNLVSLVLCPAVQPRRRTRRRALRTGVAVAQEWLSGRLLWLQQGGASEQQGGTHQLLSFLPLINSSTCTCTHQLTQGPIRPEATHGCSGVSYWCQHMAAPQHLHNPTMPALVPFCSPTSPTYSPTSPTYR